MLYNRDDIKNVDAVFAALADPTRRAILDRLARGEATVTELAAPFEISQPAVSRHLKVLEEAGLIARRVEGTRRPCRLAGGTLEEVEAWLGQLRAALTANYDRLDGVLEAMTAEAPEEPAAPRHRPPPAARSGPRLIAPKTPPISDEET